jgi:hypothetical protein
VEIRVSGAAVGQPVDQRRIAVIGDDDRTIGGEDGVELRVRQAVRMCGGGLQPHQVDHVDHPNFQVGKVAVEQVGGGEDLQGGYVAGGGQDHVGVAAVGGRPVPDSQAAGGVQRGGVHVQPGGCGLFAGHDYVDVVVAAQAVVRHGQQVVGVRRRVHPDAFGLLVHDVVDEAGVLVGRPVVVLAPHVRGEQVVQRRDRLAPTQVPGDLQPLGVLVEHRVDDVYERLVAGEQAVPAGEEVDLQPALAGVLGHDGVRHLVIEVKPSTDDVLGVIEATLQGRAGEQPAHQLAVVGLQVQRDVRGHAELTGRLVERPGLCHVARQAVQHVPTARRLRLDKGPPHHIQHDLVGHQLAAVEMQLNGTAQLRLPRDVITQQVPGRDVRNVEVGGDHCALRPLARARWRDHQHAHPRLLASTCHPRDGPQMGPGAPSGSSS